MTTTATVGTIMIDCNDIDAMVKFWCEALGLEQKLRYPKHVWLSRLSDGGPALAFQQVPEPRVGKNRIHMDLVSEDPAAFAERILELGGSAVAEHEVEGFHWSVLADPEGNVFCVTPADH